MFIEYNNIISDRRIYVKKFVIRCRRSASFSGGLDLVLRLIFLKMAEGTLSLAERSLLQSVPSP